MNREERKRKFNEAIVNTLFPPPPQYESPPFHPEEQESNPVQASIQGSGSDAIPDALDGYESASASGDEVQESESQKLTRAQRKKIRKKKLKEEAIRRGKLIGPLLPTNGDLDAHEGANHPPGVRSNASESQEYCGADEPGPPTSKKVNQRRKAKRMAKGKQNSSNSENPNQHPTSNPSVDLKDDH
ncbi:uncharacterized protein LOC129311446 isoform X2 [Prosopis cineraria]|uniref:uncharacterized protein LOC129311446 isoform X2 n=1 Tax=Prosopis cineraria TaxID=364024 RepID=UPI0024109343|nr:uncharacterized protein LOC129311446 isoform X2 [Prosopis cineraria]